eukprot:COSAG01_NODE_3027_length_6704_cov_2.846026_12_plen_185_part_00
MMAAMAVSLLLLRCPLASAAKPVVGTYLEPWYTARERYHWPFAPVGGCSGPDVQLLFGDVNCDGYDDLLRAGCGAAADEWVVSLSKGFAGGWAAGRLWWRDGAPASAERYVIVMRLPGCDGWCKPQQPLRHQLPVLPSGTWATSTAMTARTRPYGGQRTAGTWRSPTTCRVSAGRCTCSRSDAN